MLVLVWLCWLLTAPHSALPLGGHGGQSSRDWNGAWGPRGCMFGAAAAWREVVSLDSELDLASK